MKALIDGDILCYSLGSAKDESGEPLSWPLTLARLDGKIDQIIREAGAISHLIFITGKGNFRDDIGTILPYKGHRPKEKPAHYDAVKAYLSSGINHKVHVTSGIEADDAMGIEQFNDLDWAWKDGESEHACGTIICTRDKDLKMIPGRHYRWHHGEEKKKPPFMITFEEANRFFFQQLLSGDPVDNILGLFGIGEKKAIAMLDKAETQDMNGWYNKVQFEYERRFGSYWKQFLLENARLLWIQRRPDDDPKDMLDDLEIERQEKINEEVKY